MPRSRLTSQLAFPAALVVSAVAALLPMGWPIDGWTRDLAQVVRFPLKPFVHAGIVVESWLRPAPSAAEGVPGEARRLVEQLTEERDRFQQLYRRQEQRVRELQEQLRQLQQLPVRTLGSAGTGVIARVTGRNPASTVGVVELTLDQAARRAVAPDTIAVYAGVHLLGKVVDEPGPTGCLLLPVTNRANRYITARVFPVDNPDLPLEDATLAQLLPTGGGAFTAEIDRTRDAGRGDLVRLDDAGWPPTAQMMVLGEIVSVETNETEPLRNTVVVRPFYQVRQLAYVTLIIEDRAEASVGGEVEP